MCSPATNAETIARVVPDTHLVTLSNVAHYDFLCECPDDGRRVAAHYCGVSAETPRVTTHAATIAAVKRFLAQALR